MGKVFTTLAFCIFIFSCKKDTPYRIKGSAYFPNSVGNYWRYKYVDSISNKSVFVDVNIIGKTVLPGGQNANIWTYTFPDHIDTNFVYQVSDTVRFVDPGFSIRHTYIIPFVLNSKWRANSYYEYDSVGVIDNRNLNLKDQFFSNSFLLHRVGHLPNDYWDGSEWFCPNIGMITRNEKNAFLIANDFSNTYWEIIDYHLK